MRTIIAPTDFSLNAENALNYAADMATVVGANLILMHVYSIPIPVSEVPVPLMDSKELEEELTEKLREIKHSLDDRTGGRVHIEIIVKSGNTNWEIEEFCRQVQPYALVLGAESTGPLQRVFFGGVTLNAISRSEWPVIVVPPNIKFKSIRRIGLACDFRKVVDSIPSKEIKDIVREFRAELHVLHVSMDNNVKANAETVEESGWLQEILGDLNPKYHFLIDDNPEVAIARFADVNSIDLLMVIPKKHNLLARIFEHSHSKSLVLHSHVPIMSIHE